MYKYLIISLLIMYTLPAVAQKGGIKGKLVDSLNKAPVELATIAVLNAHDTTANALIAYTQSDKDGTYSIRSLPAGLPLKVVISFVGYRPYVTFFSLIKNQLMDMGTIAFVSQQLNEVTIKAERMPIIVRKDTVEFDAAAFKTRPNAVVEDLLKKLPGVEIDNDGKITVMAKPVTKVLVDGREFFASDTRIATRNLDADMIARVQVYDDRENDPDHLIPEARVSKIINLKFKHELKKSIFGKMYAGSGTQNHYQAGGLFNMFRDTLQVSLLGYTNNLNSTGFDFNDLYNNGGVNRGGNLGYGGLGIAQGIGQQKATSAGVNINNDYGSKLKINLSYLYSHSNTLYNTISNKQTFIADTTAYTNTINNRKNGIDNHIISGTLRWHPNNAVILNYTPNLNIVDNSNFSGNNSNSFSTFINPINNSAYTSSSSGSNIRFGQNLSYNKQLQKKGSSISVDHSLSYNPGSSLSIDDQDLTSFTSTLPSYSLRRRGDNATRSFNASAGVTYRNKMGKNLLVDMGASEEYNDQLDKVSTYDYNPVTGEYDSFLFLLSSDLTRNKATTTLSPGITYSFLNNFNLVAHLQGQWQQVYNIFNRNVPELDQHYFYLLPSVNLNKGAISLGYNRSMQLPNIGDMIPYSVIFSPLYSVTGNPALKPTTANNYSINYSKYNYQRGTSINISGSAIFEQNSIIREHTLDASLVETSMPVNRNGRYRYNFNGYINKRIGKNKNFQFSAGTSLNLSKGHDFFILNHQEGYQNNYSANLSTHFSLNWKDIVQVDPQYNVSETYTGYSGVDFSNKNYIRHSVNTHFNILWPQHMDLEGQYNYQYNPLVPDGFQKNSNLLSLSLARRFMKKDRAEIKLSCYDILNQNVSINRTIAENTIVDTQSQIIKRYFMLTLQFKFNKASYKQDEKKPVTIFPALPMH